MIQPGEFFSAKDLRQSFQEFRNNYDIKKYVDPAKSRNGIIFGNNALFPFKLTPIDYAEICINEYKKTSSSAVELDQQLRRKKFRTLYRFSYKYRTGELARDTIVFDAYCLDWFYQVACTAVPYEEYEEEYEKAINDAWHLSYYYAQYLWAQNPSVCQEIAAALSKPETKQWEQIISAILGIGFRFHPLDVYEFAIRHITPNLKPEQRKEHGNEQQKFKDSIMQMYGIDTGCLVLSPQNRKKLTDILTNNDTPYIWQLVKEFLCPIH